MRVPTPAPAGHVAVLSFSLTQLVALRVGQNRPRLFDSGSEMSILVSRERKYSTILAVTAPTAHMRAPIGAPVKRRGDRADHREQGWAARSSAEYHSPSTRHEAVPLTSAAAVQTGSGTEQVTLSRHSRRCQPE